MQPILKTTMFLRLRLDSGYEPDQWFDGAAYLQPTVRLLKTLNLMMQMTFEVENKENN